MLRTRSVPLAVRLAAAAAFAAATALAQSPAPRPSLDPALKKLAEDARTLAKQGRDQDALTALDRVLDAQPGLSKVRLLRARIELKLKQYDQATKDAQRALQELPGNATATQVLAAAARARGQPASGAPSPSPSPADDAKTYSSWKRSWTVPGTAHVSIPDLLGGEGYTLFYAPSDASSKTQIDALATEATRDKSFFLRIVDIRAKDGKADLTLPGSKDLGATGAPFEVLIDPGGREVARGTPDAVREAFDRARRMERNKAEADARKMTTMDFSSSRDPIEWLAASGYTTVVMIGSEACHDCQKMLPRVENLPGSRDKTRVVFANIGVVDGKINWSAPMVSNYHVRETPTFYILDETGRVTAKDAEAKATVTSWLGQ